jgi:hypothetical protein
MSLAARVGRAFARRWAKHPDECVAEAYYQLVELFTNYKHLHDHGGDKAIVMFVGRGIRTYFKGWNGKDQMAPLSGELYKPTNDISMMNYLYDIFPNEHDAFLVFDWLKNGVDLNDVEIVEPRLRRTVIRIWRQVNARLKRLEAIRASESKIRNGQSGETGDSPGEPIGEESIDCIGREWDQSQDALTGGIERGVTSKCPAV